MVHEDVKILNLQGVRVISMSKANPLDLQKEVPKSFITYSVLGKHYINQSTITLKNLFFQLSLFSLLVFTFSARSQNIEVSVFCIMGYNENKINTTL